MPTLPLTPHLKMYKGSKENLRRKNDEYNRMARRVAEHLNRQIANNPSETQMYTFGLVALELGLTKDQVFEAISDGGSNGITIWVSDEDRKALAPYKK